VLVWSPARTACAIPPTRGGALEGIEAGFITTGILPDTAETTAHSGGSATHPDAFYINEATRTVVGIGPELDEDTPTRSAEMARSSPIYPIDGEGNERVWRYGRDTLRRLIDLGGSGDRDNRAHDTYTLNHTGSQWPPRRWARDVFGQSGGRSHDAGTHDSTLLYRLLSKRNVFPFPKSLYAVRDSLEAVVKDKPDAPILDLSMSRASKSPCGGVLFGIPLHDGWCPLAPDSHTRRREASVDTPRWIL
jgi:hypothetical protein